MLHGWADSAWSMDTIAQVLVGRHQVISLDMRGHGHSDRGPYNLMHLIGDVRNVFDSLDLVRPADALDRPIVVGHSLGGQVMGQFCGLYPDLPSALVMAESLGPPSHRLADQPDEYDRLNALRNVERSRKAIRSRPLANIDDATERLRSTHPLLDPKRARFLAERNTIRDDTGELHWRLDPNVQDWLNGHTTEIAMARWRGITCPVLVVCGAEAYERYWKPRSSAPDDYLAALTGDDLAARLASFADHRYVELSGAGHMIHYEKPDELNDAILRFLDNQ